MDPLFRASIPRFPADCHIHRPALAPRPLQEVWGAIRRKPEFRLSLAHNQQHYAPHREHSEGHHHPHFREPDDWPTDVHRHDLLFGGLLLLVRHLDLVEIREVIHRRISFSRPKTDSELPSSLFTKYSDLFADAARRAPQASGPRTKSSTKKTFRPLCSREF